MAATVLRTGRLRALLADRRTDAFVEALHGLQHPELWLKNSLRAMAMALRSKEATKEAQLATCKDIYRKVASMQKGGPQKGQPHLRAPMLY